MTPFANLPQTGGPAPTANDSIDDFIDQEEGGCSIAVLAGRINTRSFATFYADHPFH